MCVHGRNITYVRIDFCRLIPGAYIRIWYIIRAKRVSNCYMPKKKICTLCVCSTNLGFSGEKKLCACSTNLGFSGGSANCYCCCRMYVLCTTYVCTWYQPATQIHTYMIPRTYYVPDTYVPGISRQTNVPPVDARTSDDSYMYQLSLVVATATVSYVPGILS